MPMRGEGDNIDADYLTVEPERSRRFIYEENGLSKEEADAFVAAKIQKANDALAAVEATKPEVGDNLIRYKAQLAGWQDRVAQAQNEVAYWERVRDYRSPVAEAAAVEAPIEQTQAEAATEAPTEETPITSAPKPADATLTEEARFTREGLERSRAERVSRRAAENLNINLNVINSVEEIPESEVDAIAAIRNGQEVYAWFSVNSGEVYVYIPAAANLSSEEIENKIAHEVIAHKGLRELLGEEEFNKFCDDVWRMMDEDAKRDFVNYVLETNAEDAPKYRIAEKKIAKGSKLTKAEQKVYDRVNRAAADEFVAAMAENMDNLNATLWERICAPIQKGSWQGFRLD